MNAPGLNWKAILTCNKCRERGYLAQECQHTGSSAIAHRQQTLIANTQQANYTGPTLFPTTNATLSQSITTETPITSKIR